MTQPATTPDAAPAPTTAILLEQFLEKVTALQADQGIDYAADLTLRAVVAASAARRYRPGPAVDVVLVVLADQCDVYADHARLLRESWTGGDRSDRRARADALEDASHRLVEVSKALMAEFYDQCSFLAQWVAGGVVEVFDYDDDPEGIPVSFGTPMTAAATTEEVTRQLGEQGFVVVAGWLQVGPNSSGQYEAGLRRALSFGEVAP